MSDNDEIKLTRKDWHLLKMFMRNVIWGDVDKTESWKAFVRSVESRLAVDDTQTNLRLVDDTQKASYEVPERWPKKTIAYMRKLIADEATESKEETE